MAKKKKQKVVYVDDGRTLADMSGIQSPRLNRPKYGSRSTAKEKWDTYWTAVRMMFVPMLVALGALTIIYVIIYIAFSFM